MVDQAKGKGIAPKRASNPADLGQSSRPPLPIRTLLEDEEDSEDYSEVIEVLKHVSAIKNISSTLASLTNSSNAAAATIGKTSYSPRFDPFSGTMDLDSPLHPPRKEPHLGPAVDNIATSNLDPPIDTGSKEGFKDTITSSIVKELSKKAYTIPDDSKLSGESNFEQWIQALSIVLRALGISNFLENPDISNTFSDSDQAVLLMLLRDSLSSSPRAAISRPIESKKEDVYNEFYALTFSTYKKGLSAFNAEFNSYLAKLTMAKIDIDPSLILNQYFKALESKFPSWVSRQKSSIRQARMLGLIAFSLNIEYLMADILEESRNLATEAYRAAYVANSSNSTPNSNSNPSKKGKNKKKGKKKASYNIKGQNYSAKSAEQASFMLGSYNLAIEEEEESDSTLKGYKKHKDFKGKGLKTSSNNKAKYKDNKPRRRPRDPALYNSWLYDTGSTDHISNSKERFTTFTPNTGQLRPINTGNSPISPAGIGSITLEVLSRKAPPTYTKLVLDNVLYLPNININIVSGVRHYDSGGCLIKETLYGGDRRYIAVLDFKKSGFFLDVKGSSKPILHANFAFPLGLSSYTTKSIEPQRNKIVVEIPSNSIRKEDYRPIIEDAIVSEAIEPNKRYKLRNSPAKGTTLEGIGPSLRGKRPLIEGNKVVEKAISSPTLKEPNIEPIFAPKPIEVIAPNQPITNEPLDNSDLISEGDKMQLDYYKLLAKTSSYILSFVYKARKRVISKDSTPTTYKQVLKLPRDERSKWLEAITKEFIQLLELGVFKFLPRSLLPSNRKLITYQNVLKVKKDAKNRPIKYKSRLVARGFIQVEGLDYTITYASTSIPPTWRILLAIAASNKAIYKLLLKYGYNPSTPNIIKLSKALYSLKQSPREWQDKLKILLKSLGYLPLISDPGVFYNAKTCHFIVTYIDNCLFIGPNIGYITDLKKRLNKYVEEAVSRFNLADSKPISIPLQPGLVSQLQLKEDIASHLCNSTEIKLYQSLVGTAIYIMLLTRVDISFTIQWLSRSLNRPTKSHLNAAKNLFKYLNSTKDYSICFSYNGNIVADLGPKLSNSSNTTTKLSRDFHSKEGSRPLTTTSTTIVDSRNSKGSSRTSIINSSLVPIGFSNSDFAGDKATSKSTYGYLYKLAEAIREVQWIIGLFSELYRPIDYPITLYRDNQGSITVANDLALHARTKHTLLKFRYVREQVKAKIVTIIYLNTKCS
ncbi:hypothetical protein P8C59_001105 [Phyllachora maydis]|uniref:Reverse transcriptase Ty1/copia-type domain-containing protein n=1 Tax=Phyllachora maydis TaxID=1825666 RepID=A0AAD9HXR8_9PEZI|nr:hypothetical protein P8C59_001105 [Phyllachora maydis]